MDLAPGYHRGPYLPTQPPPHSSHAALFLHLLPPPPLLDLSSHPLPSSSRLLLIPQGVFASGGEDKLISVWRIDPTDAATRDAPPKHTHPALPLTHLSPLVGTTSFRCQGVFASGGEDKLINVWRIDPTDAATRDAGPDAGAPPELLFQHTGHRRGVSVCGRRGRERKEEGEMGGEGGGGGLQGFYFNTLGTKAG